MKRYQNPDIFEYLAMSYALGTLQGKARLRFETLQARHLYLRAVTDAYQQQFAPLVELLPTEQPPVRVWEKISKALALKQRKFANSPWLTRLKDYLPWSMVAFASIAASIMTVLLLNFNTQPDVYMATLKSTEQQDKMMVAMVYHDKMEIAFDMPEGTLPSSKDTHMMPTFWCILKNKAMKPMRMGTLADGGDHRMPIDKKTWKDMGHVDEFAISLEPMDQPPSLVPRGEVVFSGKLAAL
jgi:anti-sigma-K factor RskA